MAAVRIRDPSTPKTSQAESDERPSLCHTLSYIYEWCSPRPCRPFQEPANHWNQMLQPCRQLRPSFSSTHHPFILHHPILSTSTRDTSIFVTQIPHIFIRPTHSCISQRTPINHSPTPPQLGRILTSLYPPQPSLHDSHSSPSSHKQHTTSADPPTLPPAH
jgi:hypothetical protein